VISFDTYRPPGPPVARKPEPWVQVALEAMRAEEIPEGQSGPWWVERYGVEDLGVHGWLGSGRSPWTFLRHGGPDGFGRVTVMSDDLPELQKHLEAVHRATGRVLITGLGLGCVLRGVLTRPGVTHVDVVERSERVLELVEPHLPDDPRIRVHCDDALAWVGERADQGDRWDIAWHDLWSDPDEDDDALPVTHARLMCAAAPAVGWQWAWAMPRWSRRLTLRRPR